MGKYTVINRQCSTKGCDHFVADHSWNDKDADGKEITDDAKRNELQTERTACNVAGCSCKSYKDDAERAAFVG